MPRRDNPWLADFAYLLDLVRRYKGREITDEDRRAVFAYSVADLFPSPQPGPVDPGARVG